MIPNTPIFSKEHLLDISDCSNPVLERTLKGPIEGLAELILHMEQNPLRLTQDKNVINVHANINQQTSKFLLTALHIATIMSNESALNTLLDGGANPDVQDVYGCTPLHHAAATSNQRFYDILIKHKAREDIENSRFATAKQIFKMTTLKKNTPETLPISIRKDGKFETLTQKMFKEITSGATYIETMIIPKEYFYKSCWSTRKTDIECVTMDGKTYQERLVNPKTLYLEKTPHANLGVFTKEKISKGQVICTYDGELVQYSSEKKDLTYLLGDLSRTDSIQPKNYRNLGSMCNAGFPNAYIGSIDSVNGLVRQDATIALKEIQPKEEIFVSYGTHAFKVEGYIELNLKDAREYVNNGDIKKSIENYKATKQFTDIIPTLYLFDTPALFLQLFLEDTLTWVHIAQAKSICPSSYFFKMMYEKILPFLKSYPLWSPEKKNLLKEALKPYFESGQVQTLLNSLVSFDKIELITQNTNLDQVSQELKKFVKATDLSTRNFMAMYKMMNFQ